jgi:hypothetical protein
MAALTSLNVSGLTGLNYIAICDCSLTELDVSGCELSYLECDHNPLTSLILGRQEALTNLYCYAVELQELDLSDSPLLLDAYRNGTKTEGSNYVEYVGAGGAVLRIDPDATVLPVFHEPSNIASTSVNFEGKLGIYVYVVLSEEIQADPDAYALVTFNGVETKQMVPDLLQSLNSGRVRVEQEVLAVEMRDEMVLQLFNGEGQVMPLTYKETEDVTDGFHYSVVQYLDRVQEVSSNAKMKELARAAKQYGIAAQVNFNYKNEQLTADEIAAMKAEAASVTIPASVDETITGTQPAGITNRTRSVAFEADNTLKMYFFIADAAIGQYSFTVDGKAVEPARVDPGKYAVEQENIAPAELSTRYSFAVTDGTDSCTYESSALAYAYALQQKSSNADMVNLVKLLYVYSQGADAYFGS